VRRRELFLSHRLFRRLDTGNPAGRRLAGRGPAGSRRPARSRLSRRRSGPAVDHRDIPAATLAPSDNLVQCGVGDRMVGGTSSSTSDTSRQYAPVHFRYGCSLPGIGQQGPHHLAVGCPVTAAGSPRTSRRSSAGSPLGRGEAATHRALGPYVHVDNLSPPKAGPPFLSFGQARFRIV